MSWHAALWGYVVVSTVLLVVVRRWRFEGLRLLKVLWSTFTLVSFSWVVMMSGATPAEFTRHPGGIFESLADYPGAFREVFGLNLWWVPVSVLLPVHLARRTGIFTRASRSLHWVVWAMFAVALVPLLKLVGCFDWSAFGHYRENYRHAWTAARMGDYFLNSVLVSISSVGLVSVLGSMAAYAVSRVRFRGSGFLGAAVIAAIALPGSVLLVPLFLTLKDLHLAGVSLANSRFGLSLIYSALSLPFTTFLLAAYYRTIPGELGHAALVDGASYWRVFTDIYFPLAAPGLATTAILNFLAVWNEYHFALVFVTNPDCRTLPVGLYSLHVSQKFAAHFPSLFAGIVILCVPSLLVFLLLQDRIVAGLGGGGSRG